jgi:ATP-dependent DNA helicase DinG
LADAIPGFRVRSQQVDMALRVEEVLKNAGVLVAEAATGTGKTFAYLVPALLCGGKVLVSTGTKTLQDQLFQRDLPTVRAALKVPVTVALLKGRANYVCPYHLERALHDGRLASRQDAADLRTIARFAKVTKSGDRAELSAIPEDAPAWALATSTRDNCLGQDCPQLSGCFVMAARREALAADVVVVNHHLFFADVMLRDEGVGELLPACNAVIFDEAHQLPETATLFFGDSVSTAQLLELARDARAEAFDAAPDFAALPEACRVLDKAARDLRLAVGLDTGRLPLNVLRGREAFMPALDAVLVAVHTLGTALEAQAERSEGLHHCAQRAREVEARLTAWRDPAPDDRVRWGEAFSQSLVLHSTPLSVADIFRRSRADHPRAWVFTSATLAVGERFDHFVEALGLDDAQTARWDSPFDYASQSLLYVPTGLPQPNEPAYNEALVDAVWPVLQSSGGRAFILCTSLRAMKRIHGLLAERFAAEGFHAPLLLQGEAAKNELLARFRAAGNAVLVASQSFWEGVDVRGEALQLVVIDRLPFAPPDDPILAARIEHLRRQGRNPFLDYQLPQAVIDIKQGAGRLIRDESDHGVLMICDPRLVDKPYGRTIWRSLPPMRRTRVLAEVLDFFAGIGGGAGAAAPGVQSSSSV